jgi:hypothetical protein
MPHRAFLPGRDEVLRCAVLEMDSQGRLKSVPTVPPDAQIEASFLVLEPRSDGTARTPPPELAGVKIVGDIVSPAIDQDDSSLMK